MGDRHHGPLSLLYADSDSSARERAALLDALDGVAIEPTTSIDAALDALETADGVVAAGGLTDGSELDLARAIRERDPHATVILYPERGSDRLASEASAADVAYLPRSLDDDGERLLERVRAEIELRERRRRHETESAMFTSMMSDLPISVYFKDREARHVRVGPGVGTDTDSVDPIGKTDPEVYAHEIGDQAWNSYEDDLHVIETGDPIVEKEEVWALDIPNVDAIWLESTKVPWRNEQGEICGLMGLTRDITELKRREHELERQQRHLDRFASFVSHDLRNPLNVANGYLELGRETGSDDAFAEVSRALSRIERLIDDLLEMTRDQAGVATLSTVDLQTTIEEIWSEVGIRDATLRNAVPDGTVITADERLLRQLFANLFRNAIQHVGTDVYVTVGTMPTGFFVEDDGPGIPDDEREQVFDFGYTGSENGSGMGLAYVAQIAESHDWAVDVTAGSIGGARFEVSNCLLVTAPGDLRDGENVTLRADTDIGGATPAGTVDHDEGSGRWTVHGGGENVWSNIDECYFVHAPLAGDGRIVARVADFGEGDEHRKAGLMIRGEPRAGAPLGFVGMTGGPATELLWRPTPDDPIASRQLPAGPETYPWFRLDRTGEQVTTFHSRDGETWVPIDERALSLEDAAAVGLAVCSHDPENHCVSVFEDVSVVEY
ncbi:ATP-binding protein [Natronobiforma cellulositropha]|uniref:ATP-binding protein n=1 Tax=Natronobiforma cellulositropha TaxID=1679076 RepID=UPI0021D60C08|nr:ATP-binding protein [Natronobiforma cellulositropha]